MNKYTRGDVGNRWRYWLIKCGLLLLAGCSQAGRLVIEWQLPVAPPPPAMVKEGEEPAAPEALPAKPAP